MEASEAPHPTAIRWSGLSHPGRFRSNNEDAFLALTFDSRELRYLGKEGESSLEEADFVFAVSDGMGGAKAGEIASRIAVERITRLLPKGFGLNANQIESGFTDVLRQIFEETHAALQDLSRHYEECRGMGATLSLCWFMPGWMCFSHVGDSRIYYVPQGGDMLQVTEDDTRAGWLFRNGKINEREARNHPQKHLLNQVLGGSTRKIDPQFGRVSCQAGDRFLICSDGLIDGIWNRRLGEMTRGPLSAPILVDFAVAESGRDNTTALLIEVS